MRQSRTPSRKPRRVITSYFITGTGWLFLLLLGAAVCGFLGALVAERTGSAPWLGGILGFCLGPLGVLVAALLPAESGRTDLSVTAAIGASEPTPTAAWTMPPTAPPTSAAISDAVPAAGATVKACPDCAEYVQAAAKVCRFCGYNFVESRDASAESS